MTQIFQTYIDGFSVIDALFAIAFSLVFLFALSNLAESSFFNFVRAFDLLNGIQETEELINEKLSALYLGSRS